PLGRKNWFLQSSAGTEQSHGDIWRSVLPARGVRKPCARPSSFCRAPCRRAACRGPCGLQARDRSREAQASSEREAGKQATDIRHQAEVMPNRVYAWSLRVNRVIQVRRLLRLRQNFPAARLTTKVTKCLYHATIVVR